MTRTTPCITGLCLVDTFRNLSSVYDDFRWMDLFTDPGFLHHVTMAQLWGLLAIDLADSKILPFNYTTYALETLTYVRDIDAVLASISAPAEISTAPMYAAQARFLAAARAMGSRARSASHSAFHPSHTGGSSVLIAREAVSNRVLNDQLMLAERAMLSLNGLDGPAEGPARSWYRHVIYAPASQNVYSTTRFPGLVDAAFWAAGRPATDARWLEVQHQVWEAARALDRAARVLNGNIV
jgi:N-acetylated-alpha-linked acidic dipeptidase